MPRIKAQKLLVGRLEYGDLPDLGLLNIKARIDTGARTSALHATQITPIRYQNEEWVEFTSSTEHSRATQLKRCKAKLYGQKSIKSSNGMVQHRYVIETMVQLGDRSFPLLLTLSNRCSMHCPLLLGRELLNRAAIVDSSQKFLLVAAAAGKVAG